MKFCSDLGNPCELVFKNNVGYLYPSSQLIIRDPTNSENNIAERLDPSELVEYAKKTLEKTDFGEHKHVNTAFLVVGHKGVGKSTLLNKLFGLKFQTSKSEKHVTNEMERKEVGHYTVIDTVGLDLHPDNCPLLSDFIGWKMIVVLIVNDTRSQESLDGIAKKLKIEHLKDKINVVKAYFFKDPEVKLLSVDDIVRQPIAYLKSFKFNRNTSSTATFQSYHNYSISSIRSSCYQPPLYDNVSSDLIKLFSCWKKRKKANYRCILDLTEVSISKFAPAGNAFLKALIQILNLIQGGALEPQIVELTSHQFLMEFVLRKVEKEKIQSALDKSEISAREYAELLEALIGMCCFDKKFTLKFDVFQCVSDLITHYKERSDLN